METLNTIATNFMILWNAPKDWSLSGGLVWLTGYVAVLLVGFVVFCIKEAKAERSAHRARIYRAAEESARVHLRMKSEKGYLERRNF
jgi:hypothetical protein